MTMKNASFLIVALGVAACGGVDQATLIGQLLPGVCAQTAADIDQGLQATMDMNSCLTGFMVDSNAATCTAKPGQTASWVCTECVKQAQNTCSNMFALNLTARVSSRTNGVSWSGQFTGTAGATFNAKFMPGALQDKVDVTGNPQPSFDYYSNRAEAEATQNGGFQGDFKFDTPVPGVGSSLDINVKASCDKAVKKVYGRTNKVPAKKCACDPESPPGK
jgi:hypothetical protein